MSQIPDYLVFNLETNEWTKLVGVRDLREALRSFFDRDAEQEQGDLVLVVVPKDAYEVNQQVREDVSRVGFRQDVTWIVHKHERQQGNELPLRWWSMHMLLDDALDDCARFNRERNPETFYAFILPERMTFEPLPPSHPLGETAEA